MGESARIGVIGTGWWATQAHMPAVVAHPEATLVAACDTDPERLRAAVEAYPVSRTYTDYREMLDAESLDGVIVVTPHATHYPITKACLQSGLHVLLEKPMTLKAAHAKELVHLARSKGLELIIGYPYHYLPQVQRAREVILSGELGRIQYVTCSSSTNVFDFLTGNVGPGNLPKVRYKVQGPSQAYNRPDLLGGGEGHLQITHSAGLLFFVTGLRAQRVSATMRNHGLAVDLVDAYSVAFEDGALGIVGGTGNAGRNYRIALSVYCERGCFLADTMAGVAMIRRADGSVEDLAKLSRPRERDAVTRNLIDVILDRGANGSPAETGWRTVELLDAAYRSAAANGEPVDVAALYD